MKKALSLILAVLLLVLVFSSCAAKTEKTESAASSTQSEEVVANSSESQEKTEQVSETTTEEADTLDVWVWNNEGAYAAVYDTALKLFHEKHPNVEVVFNTIAYGDYNTTLKTAVFGGEAPDIMQIPSTMITSLCEEGALLPITKYLNDGTFPKFYSSTMDKLKFDGEDYMVPFNVISYQVVYNKTLFNELGLQVPTTISELKEVCSALANNNKFGISVGTNDKWVGAYLIYNINTYEDTTHTLMGQAELGNIKWEETMLDESAEKLLGYIDAGIFAPGANSMDAFVGAQQLFVQGDAAMFYPFGSFDSASILGDIDNSFEVGTFPFPAEKAEDTRAMAAMGLNFGISSETEKEQLAVDFLSAFFCAEAADTLYENGMLPSYPYTYTGSAEITPIFQEIIDAQTNAVLDIPFNSAVSSGAYAAAQGIMDGSISGSDFTAALQDAFDNQ